MSDEDAFLRVVSLHERWWGQEEYPGRPTLKQILEAKVIAFWLPPKGSPLPYTVTIHNDLRDIEKYLLAIVIHSEQEMPRLRLAAIFKNRKRVRVKSVQIVFRLEGDSR